MDAASKGHQQPSLPSPNSVLSASLSMGQSIAGHFQTMLQGKDMDDDGSDSSRDMDDDNNPADVAQYEKLRQLTLDFLRLSFFPAPYDMLAMTEDETESSTDRSDDTVTVIPLALDNNPPESAGPPETDPFVSKQVILDPHRQELFSYWQDAFWSQETKARSSSSSSGLAARDYSPAVTAAANSLLSASASVATSMTTAAIKKKKLSMTEKARRAEMTRTLKSLWYEFLAEEEAFQAAAAAAAAPKTQKRGRQWV